ncbi:MAG: 4-alpha-glucanotransferase [Thermoguttaceae bacterium]|nr:4-alpha-glucanotransferase [Thermoguttaceae bacterium]
MITNPDNTTSTSQPRSPVKIVRSSGILAPLFSLPGVRDLGSLGSSARNFVDFLASAKQSWYQMLPVNPVDELNSPYAARSAFAAETIFLDLEDFRDTGLLDDEDLVKAWFLPKDNEPDASSTPQTDVRSERIDYETALRRRTPCWKKAFERYTRGEGGEKYRRCEASFQEDNAYWLDDYLLFQTATDVFEEYDWRKWPDAIRRRDPKTLEEFANEHKKRLEYHAFLQLAFDVQWKEFRQYCASKKVRLFGDVPLYVGAKSVDVWSTPELLSVDCDGNVVREAGAPADSFNPDGQRWSSPVYKWENHKATGFLWWKRRMIKTLEYFDAVRLDHFIGFYNYYSFPGEGVDPVSGIKGAMPVVEIKDGKTYEDGWIPGPQEELLDAIFSVCPKEAFVAEDLGVMNDGVHALRNHYELPGMKVLQFSFDNLKVDSKTGKTSDPLEEWTENFVAYTATHDSPPVLGWLDDACYSWKNPEPPQKQAENCDANAETHENHPVLEQLDKKRRNNANDTNFPLVADVLERYAKIDDNSAARPEEPDQSICSKSSDKNCKNDLAQEDNSAEKDDSIEDDDSTGKGVSTEYRRLYPEVAALHLATLRAVAKSPCKLAIFPIQDLLGLSNDSRVNFPGVKGGNWNWRFADGLLTSETQEKLIRLTEETERLVLSNHQK